MIALDLIASLNTSMREQLNNPERNLAWLMAELDRLLPGDGPMITTYEAGSAWADPSRWIGRAPSV